MWRRGESELGELRRIEVMNRWDGMECNTTKCEASISADVFRRIDAHLRSLTCSINCSLPCHCANANTIDENADPPLRNYHDRLAPSVHLTTNRVTNQQIKQAVQYNSVRDVDRR